MKTAAVPNVYYWSIPETLSSDDIEVASIHLQKNNKLVLDITIMKEAGIGAEGRLLALLVSAKRQNKSVVIQAESIPLTQSDSPLIRLLVFTVLGLILGRMSDSIVDYDENEFIVEIRSMQWEHLKETRGYLSNSLGGNENTTSIDFSAPIVDAFGRPPTPILWKQREPAAFTFYLKKCLAQYLDISLKETKVIERINDYVFEAFQNTYDHASKDFAGHFISGLRFISIRKYELENFSLDALIIKNRNPATFTQTDPISMYLSALQDNITRDEVEDSTIDSLLEITIADSGYGIPARMEKLENSLSLSLEKEQDLLERALKPGGSSKPSSVVGAGLGLYKMMETVCRLQGLILFRTGQLNMFRYYIDDEMEWPSTSVKTQEDWKALKLHQWDSTPSGYLSGTCISMIFPLKKLVPKAIEDSKSSVNDGKVHQLELFS